MHNFFLLCWDWNSGVVHEVQIASMQQSRFLPGGYKVATAGNKGPQSVPGPPKLTIDSSFPGFDGTWNGSTATRLCHRRLQRDALLHLDPALTQVLTASL